MASSLITKKRLSQNGLQFFSRYIQMGSIPGTITILDEQQLRRSMLYLEYFSYFIGYVASGDQIQVKGFDHTVFEIPVFFKPGFSYRAYRTSGAVLENNAGRLS